MSIPFDTLLAHFTGVRRLSDTQAIAKCPAHNDRSPSLSLTQATTPEGKSILLVNCHAGCLTPDVMGAVGLTMAALMPEDDERQTYASRPSLSPATALAVLGHELNVAVMLADGMALDAANGVGPNYAAAERMAECAARIAKVRGLARELGTPDEVMEMQRGNYTP